MTFFFSCDLLDDIDLLIDDGIMLHACYATCYAEKGIRSYLLDGRCIPIPSGIIVTRCPMHPNPERHHR